MNKNSGTILAFFILFSLFANGGAKYEGSPSIASNNSNKDRPSSTSKIWTVPPDPRCFLVNTIQDFYSDTDSSESSKYISLPQHNYDETYGKEQYGCIPTKSWGVPKKPISIPPIHFVIATVPDPLRSHLSLFFDRSMDAIQQGAQAAGYLFSRAKMPWDPIKHEESNDLSGYLAWQNYEQNRENLPGVMIFRKVDPDSQNIQDIEDLFVFVVGETPTRGIHKKQFFNTLKIEKAISNANNSFSKDFFIMGPTFSGSLLSLNDLLTANKDACGKNCTAHIFSGTVTSKTFVERFKNSQKSIDFQTFQESDIYAECHFFQYALQEDYKLSEIAELSEDETAFGNNSSKTATTNCGLAPTTDTRDKDIVHIYFPREISQLRAAYQNAQQKDPPTENSKQAPRTTLPLNLQDTGSDEDSVPAYAHEQYPLSQESVMLTITNLLRFHHSKYVLLKATDPLDLLFLTRFLRRSYPEGRIVTLGSDLLYRREVQDDLLHGIMAITPYSLMPGVDDWEAKPSSSTFSAVTSHVFPSSNSSGTYNAMLALLKTFDQNNIPIKSCEPLHVTLPLGSTCALPVAPYTEFGWPVAEGYSPPTNKNILSPPLWLTVLGRGSYWPVALLDMYVTAPKQESMLPQINVDASQINSTNQTYYSPTQSWILLNAVVFICLAIFIIFIQKGSLFSTHTSAALFAPISDRISTLLVVALSSILLLAALVVVWPWWWWASSYLHFKLIRVGQCVLLLIVCLLFINGINRRFKNRRIQCKNSFPYLPFLIIIFAVFTPLLVGWFWWRGEARELNLFSFRYIHITTGVSPLASILLLLLSGVWWTWHNLEGRALLDLRRPRLPSKNKLCWDIYHSLTEEGNDPLLSLLKPIPCTLTVYIPCIALLAVVLCGYLSADVFHPITSLEPWPFDCLYAATTLVATLFLALELSRLAMAWLSCRRLLRSLDRLFIRRAFCRLKGFSWKPLWAFGGGPAHDATRALSRETNAFQYIANINSSLISKTKFDTLMSNIKQHLAIVFSDSSGNTKRDPAINDLVLKLLSEWQKLFADDCASVFNDVKNVWSEENGPELYDDPNHLKSERNSDLKALQIKYRNCEQFVALVYVNFIVTILLRLRTVIVTIAGLYICILLSLNIYPIEPMPILRPALILTFFVIVTVVGWVYAQMHRDTILSRLTDTTPGELGMDFYIKMATFVVLPLLSLLVSQFPDVNNFLFSWLQPALQALNH